MKKVKFGDIKVIGGKRYMATFAYLRKRDAEKKAKQARKEGIKTRVLKVKDNKGQIGYQLFSL